MKLNTRMIRVCAILTTSILSLLLFSLPSSVNAQQSNLLTNQFTPLTSSLFNNLTVTSSQSGLFNPTDDFSNKGNVIDTDLTNFASWSILISVLQTVWIEVKDGAATGAEVYPGGSYAGFVVADNGLLALLNNITITTYLNGVAQESATSGGLLSLGLLTGQARIGFYTDPSKDFDQIRFTVNTPVGLAVNATAFYAEVGTFDTAGPALQCNTNTTLTQPDYPVIVQPARTGLSGVSVGSITDPVKAVDNDIANYATVNFLLGVAGSASFSIQDRVTTYPAGTFAGIDLDNPTLLGVNLLGNLTITTYLDGVQRDQFSGANLLSVPSSLLAGTGRQTVGFITTQTFDEVQITIAQTIALNLGSTRIYGMVLKDFCSTTITIPCNTLTPVTNPDFPVYVNGANTGTSGVCVGCAINNAGNVIDSDINNYATIVFAVNAVSNVSFSVAHEIDDYPANTFVGFDIGTTALLSASVAGSATIQLYNNGSLVQTGTGNALLIGANTSILDGGLNRQTIGIIANTTYDEVKITFSQVATANLGNIRIYNAMFTRSCAPTINCNQSYFLTQTNFPAYINSERTGTTGLVGALGKIIDAWNVITASATDFARMVIQVNVAGSASISVVDASTTYPAGTITGFTIETFNNILVELDLFDAITLRTYLDGSLQETRSGSDLINLGLLGLNIIGNGGSAIYNVSFLTTLPFDEVQITLGAIANVNVLNETNVYGAFIDTRYVSSGPLACFAGTFNPDFNSTYVNVTVFGDVSTNDQPADTATYGTPQADPGNPPGGTLNLNSDGSYDFTASTPGVYHYDVPVCVNAICTSRTLQITVLDGNSTTNPPVVNPDYGTGPVGDPITINSVANDGPGNENVPLDTASVTIVTPPTNGTATVNSTTGEITYTPNPGFTGRDSLKYMICDQAAPPNCGTAYQYFLVTPDSLANTTDATDDFVFIPFGQVANGNVSANDVDPEGDPQTVTPQNTNVPGVGTLSLSSNGDYTFTPAAGFSGPYDFTYTTCDDGSPSACASATLHVLVEPGVPDLTINLSINPSIFIGAQSFNIKVRVLEINQIAIQGTITVNVRKISTYSINLNPNDIVDGWTYLGVVGLNHKFEYNQVIPGNSFSEFDFPATFNGSGNGEITFTTSIVANSGGEDNLSNNTDQELIQYFP